MEQHRTASHYNQLKHKWNERRTVAKETLWQKHGKTLRTFTEKLPGRKHVAAASMTAMLMLTPPSSNVALPAPTPHTAQVTASRSIDKKTVLVLDLATAVPREVRPLKENEEKEIVQLLEEDLGFPVKAEMQGIRLNRNYGLIGGEQHLMRYPGDTLAAHAEEKEDVHMYLPSGMAPGLGAWRHFASSRQAFTEEDMMRERYYLAIPTFLAPGFNENVKDYKDFFKYRKMLVVNPKTGQAVVAVIGDAGPAEWTGKHLGGSPEVMHAVGLAKGPRKGAVLYFFLDDPNDTIPLGPVNLK